MKVISKLTALAAALTLFSATAEEAAKKDFTLEGGLGLIITTGNTETSTINASLVSHHELEKWSNDYNVEGLYKQETLPNAAGEDEERTSAQRFYASAQGNYKLENPNYRLFLFSSYLDDRLSNFDYQSTLAAGWNHKLWSNENSSFEYSIGPGYAYDKTQLGVKQQGLIARASGIYNWKISDTAKFIQTLSTEVGADNTKSRSETILNASISGSLSMQVTIKMNHNSQVNEGVEKLDTETGVQLVYSFF